MRHALLGLALLAACAASRASDDEEYDDYSFVRDANLGGGGELLANHDVVWLAACRAMAWEGGFIRVDENRRIVARDDVFEAQVWPARNGRTFISFSADTRRCGAEVWLVYHRRLEQAIDLLQRGQPVPRAPPPLP